MIETVLGPVPSSELGVCSMHEHVISDARSLAPDEDYLLDDSTLAVTELKRAVSSGQRTVVDPTGWGFGGPSPELPAISRASGMAIVAGVGVYLGRTRPSWLTGLSAETIAAAMLAGLTERLPGCEHRAGIIGVIAPDHPVTGDDQCLLTGAAEAAAVTGSALMLRLDPRYDDGPDLVSRLTAAGLPADRVVLSNVDGLATEPDRLAALAATGATLKWCFGYELPPRAPLRSATDAERVAAVLGLAAAGVAQVLACGVWTRSALHAHGGFGYDHLMARVIPWLRDAGLAESALKAMLVDEPARLLDCGDATAR